MAFSFYGTRKETTPVASSVLLLFCVHLMHLLTFYDFFERIFPFIRQLNGGRGKELPNVFRKMSLQICITTQSF